MAAWLAPYMKQLRLCLAGPAEHLFKAKGQNYELESCVSGAQILISGTGWQNNLEHNSRRLARQMGIPNIAVLDHWVNYRERFQRNGEEVLPDQIWVADAEAAALARRTFPSLPVLQLNNQWLDDLRQTVRKYRTKPVQRPARRLLYLLEPIRADWPDKTGKPGEMQGLDYWMNKLPLLMQEGWLAPRDQLEALRLRPHPSEPQGKYNVWIRSTAEDWTVNLDCADSLAESLAWADAAFGCETQALIAAAACELPTFSTIPPWAPACRLPHISLLHLQDLDRS